MTIPVVLRPLELADVPAILEAIDESRAELGPWMPWCTPDYGARGIEVFVENSKLALQAGLAFEFGVFGSDGTYLGNCGLNNVNLENKFANLGYWIRTRSTGRGFATRAVVELVRWGFEHTDFQRLEIIVAVGNLASLRVAERAGARREGVLRGRLWLGGRAHDAAVYSFVRGDQPSQ